MATINSKLYLLPQSVIAGDLNHSLKIVFGLELIERENSHILTVNSRRHTSCSFAQRYRESLAGSLILARDWARSLGGITFAFFRQSREERQRKPCNDESFDWKVSEICEIA